MESTNNQQSPASPGVENLLPIVAIGASAGGLHALERFLTALPDEFGFALAFMQHLSPDHKSHLLDLLFAKKPGLEAEEVSEGLRVLPGKLYVCPPAQEVRIQNGVFRTTQFTEDHHHLPIDEFFASLAEDVGRLAIAVIFSGAGTDGAFGVEKVRAAGGTVFVQDPATAEFPEMPLAAIDTGQMDGVLPPEDIAREILKLHISGMAAIPSDSFVSPQQFDPFFRVIFDKTGYRFNHYKKSVLSRRIRRRMYLHGMSSVEAYLEMVRKKDSEAAALASDLMIGVTSFFRDRLAWKALHLDVTRKLAAEEDDSPIRVWTPACATGEEAYSIAMMLQHELDLVGRRREIQVFATDLNDRALEKAREGIYPATIAADIPPEYMRKFFTYSEDSATVAINKEIRQHVVFAKQDLLTDPPFSRLDLVICRNLLIYLEPEAQEKCIALFHYALRKDGYLFLGNAESPGRHSTSFIALTHKKCRVYRKAETESPARMPIAVPFAAERAPASSSRQEAAAEQRRPAIQFIQEALLEEYAPAAVAINQNHEIIYHNGPTNRYLRQPRGVPSQDLLELLPENLRSRIRGGLFRASQEAKPVSIRASIASGDERKKQVIIRISRLRENLFVIVFKEVGNLSQGAEVAPAETTLAEEAAVRQLENELSATRDELQSHIEQLKSLNEELQSSNEELQAANEELETSREELQSLNEELITVNSQLQAKIEEQEETNNDLNNFLASTSIPTIFLDHRFRVKRFTPAMSRLIKLLPGDVGRPIVDMSQENLGPDLTVDAGSVLDNLTSIKREFQADASWYVRTTLPYRTADNRIEGVVITYSDVTELKQAEKALRTAHDGLEQRVRERTTELQQAYDRLRNETREREQAEEQLRHAQKLDAIGTLTGGIAHDFNNILGAIIGFAEMLRDNATPGTEEEHQLSRVLEAGIRGRDLVKNMLTFARKTEQEKKPLRLGSIVKETMKLLRASLPSTIDITVDVRSESGLIIADVVQIQQVLMNLCTNAAWAMEKSGGGLRVELSALDVPGPGGHPGMRPGRYLKLMASDSGIGMSPDVLKKAFDPFFTTKMPGEGSGLGLSVVHGIVKAHDGYVFAESEAGQGSAFAVYFPQVEEEHPRDAVAARDIPMGTERVLFIDDEEVLAEMGQVLLTRLGYQVTAMSDSMAALGLFASDPGGFDLVITDMTMPGVTGIEFARQILAIRPDIPVILCTGFSHLIDADAAKAAGVRAFVMKPLTKGEIAKTIREVLD